MYIRLFTIYLRLLLVPLCATFSCSELSEDELLVKLHRKIKNTASYSERIPSSTGKVVHQIIYQGMILEILRCRNQI